MKRETIDHFLGKEVTIIFFDGKVEKGLLAMDKYRMKNYLLRKPSLNEQDTSFRPSHVKSIGSVGLYDKVKNKKL